MHARFAWNKNLKREQEKIMKKMSSYKIIFPDENRHKNVFYFIRFQDCLSVSWAHLGFDAISSFVHEFLVFSVLDRENNKN